MRGPCRLVQFGSASALKRQLSRSDGRMDQSSFPCRIGDQAAIVDLGRPRRMAIKDEMTGAEDWDLSSGRGPREKCR